MDRHDLTGPATRDGVDPYVQQWVAGTNGNLYAPLINRLSRHPIPNWPTAGGYAKGGFLLDIGCGWGRWMVAAARAGYRPVGIDVKLDALKAARRVMDVHGVTGYVVLADLAALPFKNEAFECVFSYSVIQHAHRRKAATCISEISRVLENKAISLIELPLKHGLTNFRHFFKAKKDEEDNLDSWVVRYYSWRELKELFYGAFGNGRILSDCFCGIGVRREDIDLLPWKYKPIVMISEFLKFCTRLFPPLVRLSDSVFVQSRKQFSESKPAKAL